MKVSDLEKLITTKIVGDCNFEVIYYNMFNDCSESIDNPLRGTYELRSYDSKWRGYTVARRGNLAECHAKIKYLSNLMAQLK